MKLTAHCFADNVNITPKAFLFKYKDYDVKIFSLNKQLMLQIFKILNDHDIENIKKNKGEGLDVKMMPYKLILTEAAQILEGLFSILFNNPLPPKFDTGRINVNIVPETEEEKKMIEDGIIHKAFGDLSTQSSNISTYEMDESINEFIVPAIGHLPAFSFFAQATRSLYNNENEVAFFLYFRIIDGYFSEGVSDVEKALIKKSSELEPFFTYDEDLIKSTKSILDEMHLSSKSESNFIGFIKDMVLIRHKLTHFSSTNSKKHHSAKIIFELGKLNAYLYQACGLILRHKINL